MASIGFMFNSFPSFTNRELRKRQTDQAYLNKPRSAWMRMVSNYGLGKVMMGGDFDIGDELSFGLEGLYEGLTRTGEFLRPVPTVTGINVEEEGRYIRCTVNWDCHSLAQLNRLFPFFLNPGTTMLVDWGWDDMPLGSQVDPNNITEMKALLSGIPEVGPKSKDFYDLPRFKALKRAEGKYNFIVGHIVDFSISDNGNNSFSCTTEVTSISETAIAMSFHSQINRRSKPEGEGKVKPTLKEYMLEKLDTALEDPRFAREMFNFSVQDSSLVASNAIDATYISWRGLEKIINGYASFKEANIDEDAIIDGTEDEPVRTQVRTFNMDCSDTVLSYEPGLLSMNPAVHLFFPNKSDLSEDAVSGNFRDATRNIREFDEVPPESTLEVIDLVMDGRVAKGFLYNVYLNVGLVKDAFSQYDDVFKTLSFILKRVNASTPLQPWDLRIIPDEAAVTVVDLNCPKGPTVDEYKGRSIAQRERFDFDDIFVFAPNTSASILRSYSIDTNFSDLVQSQIMTQKHLTNDADDPDTDAAINSPRDGSAQLFKAAFPLGDRLIDSLSRDVPTEDLRSKGKDMSHGWTGRYATPDMDRTVLYFFSAKREVGFDDYSDMVASGIGDKTANVIYYHPETYDPDRDGNITEMMNNVGNGSMNNSNIPVNIEVSITLDGVSGLYMYQAFDISNLPDIFDQNGVFMVNKVSNEVSQGDWTTTINGAFVIGNAFGKNKNDATQTSFRTSTHRSRQKNVAVSDLEASSKREFAITYVLVNEGGFVDDPADPGGKTNFGIASAANPDVDVENLNVDKAKQIYQERYWDPYAYDEIESTELATKVFDTHVNTGPAQAHRITQRSLNDLGFDLEVNGRLDQATVDALNEVTASGNEAAFNDAFVGRQSNFYRSLGNDKFLSGWLNRARKLPVSNIT